MTISFKTVILKLTIKVVLNVITVYSHGNIEI